ncbi:hypothetical protein V6Z11_A05G343000 [Gossypium hirsutum]
MTCISMLLQPFILLRVHVSNLYLNSDMEINPSMTHKLCQFHCRSSQWTRFFFHFQSDDNILITNDILLSCLIWSQLH